MDDYIFVSVLDFVYDLTNFKAAILSEIHIDI